MFRHTARILAVIALANGGCSGTSTGRESEPRLTETTQDPADTAADAALGQPSDQEPGGEGADGAVPIAMSDAGKPGDTENDASSPDAQVGMDRDAGAETYDPEKGNPWSIERDPVPNDHNWCLNSAFVQPGHFVGDVGGNTNDYTNPDKCGDGLPSEGRDAWVKIKVPNGKTLSVWGNVKETGDFDAVLYLLAGSCGKLGTCVAGANENLAIREHATWRNDTGAEATVHIVFDLLLPSETLNEKIPYYLDIALQ